MHICLLTWAQTRKVYVGASIRAGKLLPHRLPLGRFSLIAKIEPDICVTGELVDV